MYRDSHSCIVGHRGRNRGGRNPIRAHTEPGGSDPLAGSDSLLNLATNGNRYQTIYNYLHCGKCPAGIMDACENHKRACNEVQY